MKQLTTNDQPLALPQFPKWTYFGFTYKKSTKGKLSETSNPLQLLDNIHILLFQIYQSTNVTFLQGIKLQKILAINGFH